MSDEGGDPMIANDPDELEKYIKLMASPATRGELLTVLGLMQKHVLSNALIHASLINGNIESARRIADKGLDISDDILSVMRDLSNLREPNNG